MPGQFILYNKSKIYFRREGYGKPVLLIHGFGEDGSVWQNQVDALKDKYLLIIPDLPGSGQSEILDGNNFEIENGIEIYARVIKFILDHLGISSCTIIGHSMGGYITLAFAHLYPDMLEKFGLFHSSAFADNEEKVIARENAIGFIKLNGAAAFLKTMIPSLFSDVYKLNSYPIIEKLVESSVNFSPEALIQYYQAMIKRPDRTDVFQSFTRPILFIIGEKDRAIPLDQSLKQCYQPFISDIHLLPEAAHMGMMEDAVNCNNFIISFLSHC